MNYSFKVKKWSRHGKGKNDETGPITGPDAFAMAMRQAQFWEGQLETKSVNILRADDSGINAGKFFLHLIIK